MNTYIFIFGLIACLCTVIIEFFKKDFTVLQKVNSTVYTVSTGLFLICVNYILTYFKSVYGISNTYMNIITTVFSISTLIGFVFIIILNFFKNNYLSRIYSLVLLITAIAFSVNILYYNPTYKFMMVIVFVLTLLNITMMTNSTELLSKKTSVIIYFTVNILNCAFWSICLFLFTKKISAFDSLQIVLLAIFIIVAFSGTLLGIFTLKRKKNK